MKKLEGKSKDILDENISKIKEIFPEVFEEGKIDFEYLRKVLGDSIDSENEKYSFNWNGKSDAIKTALKPTTATLRPDKESSKDWDKTENLFIEGDNLEVLKVLQDSYRNKIKMIYIDPPYNTGKDFVYSDKFNDTVDDYKERTEQAMISNADTSGRYHTNWLNMMYPRLRLARNLLKDDGVIFISIDDNEVANLRKICDEIFGEVNLLGVFTWQKKTQPSFLSKEISVVTEHILVYKKSGVTLELKGGYIDMDRTGELINIGNPAGERTFRKESIEIENGLFNGILKAGQYGNGVLIINLLGDVNVINGKPQQDLKISGRITMSQKTLDEEIEKGATIFIKSTKTLRPTIKRIRDGIGIKPPISLLSKVLNKSIPTNTDASSEMKELFDGINIMDYPKPVNLIKYFADSLLYNLKEDIVLDFFAGSGTTGHAVMDLNAEDGGDRKFILVQIPEKTDEKSEAYKAGYKTISEISMERIRRAGEKIKQDNKDKEGIERLDIGFKAFRLASTNLTQWDSQTKDLEKTLEESINSAKSDRTQEDVLYEVLLKYGINLTTPIKSEEINGKKVFSIAGGYLLVCLEKDIDLDTISKIAGKKPERVVFYDHGFKDDMTKLNAEQTLKKAGVEDVRVI